MDQAGAVTNTQAGDSGDGAVSLIGALDRKTRTQCLNACASNWAQYNSPKGYAEFLGDPTDIERPECWLTFYWNEDYTKAHIGMMMMTWVTFTIELQEPPLGACPPGENADKDQNTKCAKWVRSSNPFGLPWGQKYYLPEIVDGNGGRTVFYDEYVKWANSQSQPNATMQHLMWGKVRTTGPYDEPDTSMVGPSDPAAGGSVLPASCPIHENRANPWMKQYACLAAIVVVLMIVVCCLIWCCRARKPRVRAQVCIDCEAVEA